MQRFLFARFHSRTEWALLCGAAKQKKSGTETDKLQIMDYGLTRSLLIIFQQILESSIHRRICNMVGVITDYF
jgi:hypothetical protein